MDYDIETLSKAYMIATIIKGAITYVIPVLMFLVICLMNVKLGEVQYELRKLRQVISDKEEEK